MTEIMFMPVTLDRGRITCGVICTPGTTEMAIYEAHAGAPLLVSATADSDGLALTVEYYLHAGSYFVATRDGKLVSMLFAPEISD